MRQEQGRRNHHDRADRDWNPLHANGGAERVVEDGDEPVAEDRLVQPRLVVERGADVVPAFDHFAWCFYVECLIGVPDRGTAQVDEIGNDREAEEDRKEPTSTGQGRRISAGSAACR